MRVGSEGRRYEEGLKWSRYNFGIGMDGRLERWLRSLELHRPWLRACAEGGGGEQVESGVRRAERSSGSPSVISRHV